MTEEIKKLEKPNTDEIATIEKDIDLFAGWLKRLENPDTVLRSEAGGKGLRLYDEVDRDAHAGSVLQQRILAIVGKEWEIIPAKSTRALKGRPAATTREQVVADYVSAVLENCNFDQARQEILKAILYGHYEAEVLWQKTIGNTIGIKKIIGKHPRRFVFTPQRELRLLTPQNMIDGEEVPERKFIVFTYGDTDNPYGRGLGQRLWWPTWFKKHGVKFWMVFLEKFGMPTVVGKYPAGTLPAKQTKLMNAIKAIQTDTGIKIPDTMAIEFLEASRSGSVTHEQLCVYMDKQISKAVLGQTATTDGTPGSLGAQKEQSDVRQEIIEADADLLDACLNDSLIKWIVDYNFPAVTDYPKIKTYAVAKPSLKEQSEIDKTLVVDIGLPVGKAYFYSTYGIPVPEEGEELVVPAKKSSSSVIPAKAGIQEGKQFAESTDRDAPDVIAGNLAMEAMPVTDALLAVLKKQVDQAQSFNELRAAVASAFSELDPAGLGEVMARAFMLAEMTGRYEVAHETGTLTEKKSPEFAVFSSPFDKGGVRGIYSELLTAFRLPFKEQATFFRKKLNIPTLKWTDLWKAEHAKGFMVAGAYRDDLLADFREAVDKAVVDGVTLADFRKDFDRIVKTHGWSYNGSRNWRSEVIYSTNIRTSYAAGRWEQLNEPEVIEAYPYLEYRHGDSRHPRPQHLAWNGITLPRDDPWWEAHYPPNGWGCKCKVFAATGSDQRQAARKGMATAPPSPIDLNTGEPIGIDKGWGYNIGKAAQNAIK